MYQCEDSAVTSDQGLDFKASNVAMNANSSPLVSFLHADHHRGVGASQPVRIYLPGAMGRAAGSAVLSYLLGGAGDRVGQHHGLTDGCAGTLRLWSGHGQPASGQTQ